MKKIFFSLLISALASNTFAQSSSFCELAQKDCKFEIISSKSGFDSLVKAYITTTCPLEKEGKWNSYAFYTSVSLDALATSSAKTTLYINKKPYTGLVRIAESKEPTNFLFYQFKGGKFERVEEKSNEVSPMAEPLIQSSLVKPQEVNEVPIRKPKPIIKPNPEPQPPVILQKPSEYLLKKPVLYLYPTEKQEISVKVDLKNQQMIHPYPAYNAEKGWEIIASPDGNLVNKATGKSHYCLFWESEGAKLMDNLTQGFVVKGEECATFLEEKLAKLGLNEKEANEFIIYWLPQLENNPYNAVYFAQTEYEKVSKLEISPAPETQIRVMMVWQGLEEKINLPEQILPQTPDRKGFTVVEWGGTELKAQEIAR